MIQTLLQLVLPAGRGNILRELCGMPLLGSVTVLHDPVEARSLAFIAKQIQATVVIRIGV